MLRNFKTSAVLWLICIFALLSSSCANKKTQYVIGVSQCSEDSWRTKLQQELDRATYFNEGVELRFKSAHDDSKLQEQQIDSLVQSGIDLLIVSPNQIDKLTDAIDRAYDKGIPVILYDRRTNSEKYTTFMGADNYLIGEILGKYLVNKLAKKGKIIEIGGLVGSSPAQERHAGFVSVIKNYPEIEIVAYQNGDWTEASGESVMRNILKEYNGTIDAVFGGNDRMALGSRRAMRDAGYETSKTIFLGVDALPSEGGGIQMVNDSILTASAIYPTQGDDLLQLALDILNGNDVSKEISMRSSIVTNENSKVLLLQNEEVVRQANYLKKMHTQATSMHESIRNQRTVIGSILVLVALICVFFATLIREYRVKHKLSNALQTKNEELESQRKQLAETNTLLSEVNTKLSEANEQLLNEKEMVERQRDELEEQRDKLIELSLNNTSEHSEENMGEDVLDGNEHQYRRENEFMRKFLKAIEDNISNSDLSVEDIGAVMFLSRVQLYRKVKALTGKSPVEIIREERLKRAHQLLADSSLNISEIAYRVGFSSPSYFTKCYKDLFGKSPTDVQKM